MPSGLSKAGRHHFDSVCLKSVKLAFKKLGRDGKNS